MSGESNNIMYAILVMILIISGGLLVALSVLNSATGPSVIVIGENGNQREVYLSEIMDQTDLVEATSGYENRFNNTRDVGVYRGIKISDLIQFVGTMKPSDILMVKASDGYSQNYTYSNVYPNASEYSYQGDMILAFSYNGTLVPNYADGYRIMFVPSDGYYENADAIVTTEPMYYFGSAGSRCVSNVMEISIISS